MRNQPSSYSADSLTAPGCHGHSFPCSFSAPCNNYRHFSRFWDQSYGVLRLGIGTWVRLWSQFQIINWRILHFFRLLGYWSNMQESQPFCRNFDDFLCNSWESVGNEIFVLRKGVCWRAHVGKWAARQQQLRKARWMQVDYCCTCFVVMVYSHVCSRPSAFTSRRDTTSWLALFFFWFGIHTASVPSIAETRTGGGTVLGSPRGSSARRHSRNIVLK